MFEYEAWHIHQCKMNEKIQRHKEKLEQRKQKVVWKAGEGEELAPLAELALLGLGALYELAS